MEEKKVPLGASEGFLEEKRSKFIATLKPVSSAEEAENFVKEVRKKYYDARHNCFAYFIDGGAVMRCSDDGEPTGSAGMPILNVLKSSGITDMCVVVTRYFGGILLGTGGLARAYGGAAKLALDAAGAAVIKRFALMKMSLGYSEYQKVSSRLSSYGAAEDSADFAEKVTLTVTVPEARAEELSKAIVDLTGVRAEAETVGFIEKPFPISENNEVIT